MRARTSSKYALRSSCDRRGPDGSTRSAATLSGRNPRSVSSTFRKLRLSKPAPTRSTQASAISETTSAPRIHCRALSPVAPRPEARSASPIAEAGICSAGERPNSNPAATASARAKRSGGGSEPNGSQQRERERAHSGNGARARDGERDAEQRSARREHETLGEHLPDPPRAARAERGADCDLLLPRGGAREQHVRKIRADDQHDDGHAERQQRHRGAEAAAD